MPPTPAIRRRSKIKQCMSQYKQSNGVKFLAYQLVTVGYWPTVAMRGDGELGFDSGEGA